MYSDEDSLVLEIAVGDGKLVRERHDDGEYQGTVQKGSMRARMIKRRLEEGSSW